MTHHPDFEQVLNDAYVIFESHRKKKGDSWKHMGTSQLIYKLKEELGEFCGSELNRLAGQGSLTEVYYEALDIINVIMMVAERYRAELVSINSSDKSEVKK